MKTYFSRVGLINFITHPLKHILVLGISNGFFSMTLNPPRESSLKYLRITNVLLNFKIFYEIKQCVKKFYTTAQLVWFPRYIQLYHFQRILISANSPFKIFSLNLRRNGFRIVYLITLTFWFILFYTILDYPAYAPWANNKYVLNPAANGEPLCTVHC